jgi:hypothetical protein
MEAMAGMDWAMGDSAAMAKESEDTVVMDLEVMVKESED